MQQFNESDISRWMKFYERNCVGMPSILLSEMAQIELGILPLQNYTRAYSQQELAVALRFYGDQRPLVTDIINSVYVDPPNLNDSQNVEWLKVISRVRLSVTVAHVAKYFFRLRMP